MKEKSPIAEKIIHEKKKGVHHTNSLTGRMKAVQIHQYGGPTQLIYELAQIPKPGPDEMLIKVYAAGVNPIDWKIREGDMKGVIPYQFPLILGWDIAGSVVHAGILVTRFKSGDFVIARPDFSNNGGYAEYAIVKAKDTAFAPKYISIHEAAGIPLVSQTAWTGLFEVGGLKENQKILIHGASGGVGSFAVQLAKITGAYVIATTSAANTKLVKSLGADEVINYKKQDFSKNIKDLDMVFDTVGGKTQAHSWKTLRKGGTLVSTVGVDKGAALKYNVTGKSFMNSSDGARLQEIVGLIDKKLLRVVIDSEFMLEKTQKAHELSQSGKASGKIILRIRD